MALTQLGSLDSSSWRQLKLLWIQQQRFKQVVVNYLEDHLLAAVASRLARQQMTSETKVDVWVYLVCKNQDDAIAISSHLTLHRIARMYSSMGPSLFPEILASKVGLP